MGILLRFYELIPFRRSISSCPAGGKAAPPVNADFRLRYFEASKHRVIADDMIFHIVD